jgi:hypothetical protein
MAIFAVICSPFVLAEKLIAKAIPLFHKIFRHRIA